jgi:Mg2+/Co2+ transporter CorB
MNIMDHYLWGLLLLLIMVSGFFSGSETGLTAINRYRLQHLFRSGYRPAIIVQTLLKNPERLLTLILIGNTFANVLAATIAGIIAKQWYGDMGVWFSSIVLTVVILIFAEVMPKTFAVHYPEKVAFVAAYPLRILLWIFYPLVIFATGIAHMWLSVLGVHAKRRGFDHLSQEELKGLLAVNDRLSSHQQTLLLGMLDIEKMTVNDVMIARQNVEGVDLDLSWTEIIEILSHSRCLRVLAYRGNVNQAVGFIDLAEVIKLQFKHALNRNTLRRSIKPIAYIPERTLLSKQLLQFKRDRNLAGLVVDEYGEVKGMVSLEDILEEIIGDFSMSNDPGDGIDVDEKGNIWVDGAVNIRDVNRRLGLNFPVDGPNTIGGIIIEYLEHIPKGKLGLVMEGVRIEVVKVSNNQIKTVKLML